MHRIRSIRRLALGIAVAGAAIGAVPAMANAASTCSFDPALKRVTVVDGSVDAPLRVVRSGVFITFADGDGAAHVCSAGNFRFASVDNTDAIWITRGPAGGGDTVTLDESAGVFGPGATPESTGTSEIETTVFGLENKLTVIGTAGPDDIRVAAPSSVDLNGDDDTDLTAGLINMVDVSGGSGNDFLSGRGYHGFSPPFARVLLKGGEGNDTLQDDLEGGDFISGEQGDDFVFAADGHKDFVSGGPGTDLGDRDPSDVLIFGADIEQPAITDVGRLQLAPHVLRARAGKTARLTMSWKHPKAWRELGKVKIGLYRGNEAVGTINARPGSGRLTGTGAVDLMSGSRLSHHDKWVTAKVALRLPKSLAGQNLRLAVQATDRHGQRQLEPDAGAIHVAK